MSSPGASAIASLVCYRNCYPTAHNETKRDHVEGAGKRRGESICRASSLVSSLAAESPPRLLLEIDIGKLLPVTNRARTRAAGSGLLPSGVRLRWPRLPTDQLALLVVLGPVDLAASKAPIENVNRCSASSAADGRVIRHPDNNGCQTKKTARMMKFFLPKVHLLST